MSALFTQGSFVKFDRNATVKSNSVKIAFVLNMDDVADNPGVMQTYIIEYPDGWTPAQNRISEYALDVTKKYLFVLENELTAI